MLNYKEYIYAIYKERSFSKAAQKLYVSQPWLSSVVKKVEQEIKTPLFDRSTSPISLTEAGRYYIKQVERVMEIEEEMKRRFEELNAGKGAELRIGSSMFFCTYVLPSLMQEFQAMYPDITLTFMESSPDALLEKLKNHQLDLFLEAEQPKDPMIQSAAWATEEIVLAVPASFPINRSLESFRYSFKEWKRHKKSEVQKPPVPLAAFDNEPFLLLNEGNDMHSRSLSICRRAGFVPKAAAYLTQMMTAYYLVCEGRGVSFLRSTIPEYVSPTDSIVFYRLEDPEAIRNIYLSSLKKPSSPVQQRLIQFMWNQKLL